MKKRFQNQTGLTLVEILIASMMGLLVLGAVYSFLYYSNLMAVKCMATNYTGVEARTALDQLRVTLQTAYAKPRLINTSGVYLSDTGTAAITASTAYFAPVATGATGTLSGTGAGIYFPRYVGGPYQTTIPTAGLVSSASPITIKMDKTAIPCPPVPQKYDILAIHRSALLSGTTFQAWATVANTTGSSVNGNIVTYTVSLTGSMTDGSGPNALTGTAIGYETNVNGVAATCYTLLLRPTAFVFKTSGSLRELGRIDPAAITSSSVNLTTNYTVISREVDSGTRSLTTPASQFALVTLGDEMFVSFILGIRSSEFDNYLTYKQAKGNSVGFTSYMGLSSFIHLKSKP